MLLLGTSSTCLWYLKETCRKFPRFCFLCSQLHKLWLYTHAGLGYFTSFLVLSVYHNVCCKNKSNANDEMILRKGAAERSQHPPCCTCPSAPWMGLSCPASGRTSISRRAKLFKRCRSHQYNIMHYFMRGHCRASLLPLCIAAVPLMCSERWAQCRK